MSTVATTDPVLTPRQSTGISLRGLAAGCAAEDRPGAELRHHHHLRLRLHRLDGLSVVHQFQDLSLLCADRGARLSAAVALDLRERSAVLLVHLDHQHGDLRLPLYRHLPGARPVPRHPARPEDPWRGSAPADLPLSDGALLHCHRRCLEMVPRSRPRAGTDAAPFWLDELPFRLDQEQGLRHLHRRHRSASGRRRASSWRCSW